MALGSEKFKGPVRVMVMLMVFVGYVHIYREYLFFNLISDTVHSIVFKK